MIRLTGRLIASIESYQYHRARSGLWHRAMRMIARARHTLWSILTSSDIAPTVRFGKNLQLPHPNGIVIHKDAVIGDNCMLMQQVTIGMTVEGLAPVLSDGVYVGAGAKLLGKIKVGEGARIGANAVVLSDIPPQSTAVGIPARVIQRGTQRRRP